MWIHNLQNKILRDLNIRSKKQRKKNVSNLDVKNTVDLDADVILGDRSLIPNRNSLLLKGMNVRDAIHAGNEEVDPRLQSLGVFAEPLDHARLLLRHDPDPPVRRRIDSNERI